MLFRMEVNDKVKSNKIENEKQEEHHEKKR